MATTKIKKELISDQAIDASKLDVTGNGTAGQALLSDGDGTFSWGQAGETYTAGTGITLSGTQFSIGQSVGTNNDVQFNNITSSGYIYLNGSDQAIYQGSGTPLAKFDQINNEYNFGGVIYANLASGSFEMNAGGSPFMVRNDSVQATTFIGDLRSTGDVIAYYSSDERLKENIKPIENALAKIESIGGYTYEWNDNQSTYEGSDIGVIAQEIEAIAPELVIDRETGYKAVKYEKLVAVLIEGIKELSAKVNELENKL